MVLNFHLVDGLTWSDGVQSDSSRLCFQLSGGVGCRNAPGLKWAEMRTSSYAAVDVEKPWTWIGKPGFTTSELENFSGTPLPSHAANGALDWSTITGLSQFTTLPLSYGPFAITSRSEDAVLLTRNPNYYRLDEGLPILDEVMILAIGKDKATAVASLESGVCDVLDSSFGMEDDLESVAALQADFAYDVLVTSTGAWEQLVFGITPASYDEYFNPAVWGPARIILEMFAPVRQCHVFGSGSLLNTGLDAITSLMPGFCLRSRIATVGRDGVCL